MARTDWNQPELSIRGAGQEDRSSGNENGSGKVLFRACTVPARPEIRAFLSLRMFVLSVVILGDFAE